MTDSLAVPGAVLSHDVTGTGPLLLLIPGGAMDSAPFTGLASALSGR
ncbi:hypothetical protein EV383_5959 [Pseudonocardia sediminis]|uniref:Alpha/beta hydrolase n=1 Tax=Pseudonocardia sediminis TaxID=1397368 RepID=A0A4Q7V4Q8_PSEST|nr:hypothetical protein [Pseudonocardia sediminis]RZT89005.1 hypothetical protein EV383_5959 [Pseudonocardia sediminis]